MSEEWNGSEGRKERGVALQGETPESVEKK